MDGKGETITATMSGSGENIGVVREYVGALARGSGIAAGASDRRFRQTLLWP